MRLRKTYENGNKKAKVYSNPEWQEHLVKFYVNGVHQKKADYHTDHSEDAHNTAQIWLKEDSGIPINNASSGNVQGLSSSPPDPPVNIKKKKPLVLKRKPLRDILS
jgi:hypothetical protein